MTTPKPPFVGQTSVGQAREAVARRPREAVARRSSPDRPLIGVLLMAYGSPDTADDVEPYYTHIRGGQKPAPQLVENLKARYALVGGCSPLSAISEAARAGLETQLVTEDPGRYRVFLGMKHWHPYIEETIGIMAQQGITSAVGLVLAPHYSSMSIGGYYRAIDAAQEKLGTDIEVERIESWHLHPPYLKALATRVRTRLNDFICGSQVTVVFTAHSLPERVQDSGDLYPEQLLETSKTLAAMLRLERWTFSYQSAGRTPEPWLGPDLVDTLHSLAGQGVQHVLVVPIGFVSDHLEILYDIDHEAQQAAREHGMTLKRIESLNASPDFVEGLAELVRSRTPVSGTPAGSDGIETS